MGFQALAADLIRWQQSPISHRFRATCYLHFQGHGIAFIWTVQTETANHFEETKK